MLWREEAAACGGGATGSGTAEPKQSGQRAVSGEGGHSGCWWGYGGRGGVDPKRGGAAPTMHLAADQSPGHSAGQAEAPTIDDDGRAGNVVQKVA